MNQSGNRTRKDYNQMQKQSPPQKPDRPLRRSLSLFLEEIIQHYASILDHSRTLCKMRSQRFLHSHPALPSRHSARPPLPARLRPACPRQYAGPMERRWEGSLALLSPSSGERDPVGEPTERARRSRWGWTVRARGRRGRFQMVWLAWRRRDRWARGKGEAGANGSPSGKGRYLGRAGREGPIEDAIGFAEWKKYAVDRQSRSRR
jgi:hypothetical protein